MKRDTEPGEWDIYIERGKQRKSETKAWEKNKRMTWRDRVGISPALTALCSEETNSPSAKPRLCSSSAERRLPKVITLITSSSFRVSITHQSRDKDMNINRTE